MLFSAPLFLVWALLCIAEANRTPFDLAEGESEIVSGFNIEYGGGLFAFIFIREYGMIMFLRFITALIFIGGRNLLIKTFLICTLFVWVRRSFPRVRYDKLIIIA
jgi:NADH-ubiquinone oxidoreductase chain 1